MNEFKLDYDLSLSNEMEIVLEVEDITKATIAESETMNSKIDQGAPSRRKKTFDTDTDDILGTKDDDKESEFEKPKSRDNTENSTDDNSETANSDNDQDNTMDEPDMDVPDDIPQDPTIVERKTELRKNVIALHSILDNSIQSLNNKNIDGMPKYLKKHYHHIQSHLLSCKTALYKIGTEDLYSKSYAEILQKYVACKKIYDICILMLDRVYDVYVKEVR